MTTSKNILNKKNFNNYLNDYINTINEEDSYMNLFSVFPTNNIINKNVEFNYKEEYSFKNNDDPQDDEESNENVEEIINIKNNFVKDSIKIYFNNKIYKNINSSSIGKNIINRLRVLFLLLMDRINQETRRIKIALVKYILYSRWDI